MNKNKKFYSDGLEFVMKCYKDSGDLGLCLDSLSGSIKGLRIVKKDDLSMPRVYSAIEDVARHNGMVCWALLDDILVYVVGTNKELIANPVINVVESDGKVLFGENYSEFILKIIEVFDRDSNNK